MRPYLRAGIAIFNEGCYHEAHDAWEDYWLELPEGDDERFLHGLIQATAAAHHTTNRNWKGATGLAESSRQYLSELPSSYRGVDLAEIRQFLDALSDDPTGVEPPQMTHEGTRLTYDDLEFPAAVVVAEVIAEESDGKSAALIERATAYAEADLAAGMRKSPFVSLLLDFALEPDQRDIAYQRLTEHVDRRAARETDVDGLFEDS